MIQRRCSDPWTKTVEIPMSELPPPPSAAERVLDCLERAALWAPEVGADVADAIRELLVKTKGHPS